MGAWGTGVLDAQRLATYIELVATIRLLLFAGEATRELTAVVSEQFDDLHGCTACSRQFKKSTPLSAHE